MKRIGFLGCGRIGSAMLETIRTEKLGEVLFIQDPFLGDREKPVGVPVIRGADEDLYRQADLIIECATQDALIRDAGLILKHSNLLMFSATAFGNPSFERDATALARRFGKHIYIPHGAILGLDGIRDGKSIWEKVSVETVKNPKSLGRDDTERTVLYHGSTREACRLFPRNVNVHATIALAGIGFDRTESTIVADPAVHTNSHIISLESAGSSMQLRVSSASDGGVSGKYTVVSACGSLRCLLGQGRVLEII